MKNLLLSLFLILGVSSSLFSQAVFTSTCGYSVTLYIQPVEIIVTSGNCAWGYNYNVRYHYNIVTSGSANCGTGTALTDFKIQINCNNGQVNGGYGLPLAISNSSGYLTTSTNPSIPHNGTAYGYTAPYVNCNAATVENFQCNMITATINGPGTFNSYTLPLNPGVLPIELLSFNAKANQNQVDLSWITGSEKNNDFFTIERTSDGITYEEVAQVEGQGNSSSNTNYEYTDARPLSGVSYYRLKQTDFNGESEVFEVKSVNMEIGRLVSNVYPNPTVLNRTTVFIAKTDAKVTLNVRNIVGQILFSKEVDSKLNDVYEELELTESGQIFLVEIVKDKVIIARHKVLKN